MENGNWKILKRGNTYSHHRILIIKFYFCRLKFCDDDTGRNNPSAAQSAAGTTDRFFSESRETTAPFRSLRLVATLVHSSSLTEPYHQPALRSSRPRKLRLLLPRPRKTARRREPSPRRETGSLLSRLLPPSVRL